MATNAEIFRVPEDYPLKDDDGAPLDPGWYYWYCMPGCLPDSEAFGPHASAAEATRAAREDDEDEDDDGPAPRLKITLDNLDDTEGMVLVTCADRDGAISDQSIEGCRWEAPRDMDVAYAKIMDRPGLLAALVADGYDVNADEYSPPDADQDDAPGPDSAAIRAALDDDDRSPDSDNDPDVGSEP